MTLCTWLQSRPEISRILYPPLAGAPGHALWKRDFKGGCGLFGVILTPYSKRSVDAMLDGFKHFKLGYSWGGFESLVIPTTLVRTATHWHPEGPTLRFHAGLEDVQDLQDDLEQGLARLKD